MWSSTLGIMTATPAMLQNQDRFHHHCDIKDNFYVLVVNTHRGETCLLFRPNPSQQLCRLPRRQFLWRPRRWRHPQCTPHKRPWSSTSLQHQLCHMPHKRPWSSTSLQHQLCHMPHKRPWSSTSLQHQLCLMPHRRPSLSIAPAPAVSYVAPAPVVENVAAAPAVYAAPAPVVEYIAPAPAVYAAPAPVVEYIAPAPAVTTLISSPPPVLKELPPTTVQGGRVEIHGQVAPVFLGTAPPVAGVGAPQVMAPPPTTAVEVMQGPPEYVQGAARPATTVTARDPQIYTAPAARPPQVMSIAPAPAVVLPTVTARKPQVTTAATVYQKGTVTYTAPAAATTVTTMAPAMPATTVVATPAPIVEYIAPAPAVYAAPAPVVEYIAPAPAVVRRSCACRGVHRASTSSI